MTHKRESTAEGTGLRINRRKFIATSAGTAGIGLTGCISGSGGSSSSSPTENSPLNVEFYGGVFKEQLDKHLVKPFQEETGIPVTTKAGLSATNLVKLRSAVDSGNAELDLLMAAPINRVRGQNMGLWYNYSLDDLENSDLVRPKLLPKTDDGQAVGVGSYVAFHTLITQTELFDEPITSWHSLWDSQYKSTFAAEQRAQNFLIDVTANIFDEFNGKESLKSKDGIIKVLQKLSKTKPQMGMWYDGEAEAQQALLEKNVGCAKLFNDIGIVMEENGAPVNSVFPEEGAIRHYGTYQILKSTSYPDAAKQFINYSLRPKVQKQIVKNLFTGPVIKQSPLNISDSLYSRVTVQDTGSVIDPYYHMYVNNEKWLNRKWKEMIL